MKSTRFITEGAVLLAIFTVLLLIATYLPISIFILTFFMPLPFILFSLKYNLKESILLCCLAMILTIIITSLQNVSNTFMYSTVGITIGYLLRKERSKEEILITSTFLYLLHIVLLIYLMKVVLGIDLVKQLVKMGTESIHQTKTMYSSIGVPIDEAKLNELQNVINLLPVLLPSLLLVASFVLTFFTQMVTFPIIRRFGFNIPKFKPFKDFKLPIWFMWPFLVLILLSMIKVEPNSFVDIAIINLNALMSILLIIQGFAFIFNISDKRNQSKSVPILILILSFVIPPLMTIVMLLGIISIGFNNRLRK